MNRIASNDFLCRSANVQAYFDGDLDSPVRLLFARHLGECEMCADELRAFERLRLLVSLAFNMNHGSVFVPLRKQRSKNYQWNER